jgi:hypothetical protein
MGQSLNIKKRQKNTTACEEKHKQKQIVETNEALKHFTFSFENKRRLSIPILDKNDKPSVCNSYRSVTSLSNCSLKSIKKSIISLLKTNCSSTCNSNRSSVCIGNNNNSFSLVCANNRLSLVYT